MVDRIDSILGFKTLKPKEVKLTFQCGSKYKKVDSDSGPFDSKASILRRKRKRRHFQFLVPTMCSTGLMELYLIFT